MNNDCPTQENLGLLRTGKLTAAERATLELHLAECAVCRRNLAALFSAGVEESETFMAPDFLKEKVKNSLVKKSPADKMPVTAFSFFGSWRKFWPRTLAAVLVIGFTLAGFYVWRLWQTEAPTPGDTLRNGSSTANSVKLLSPADGANLSGTEIDLRWAQISNTKSYTLFVSDEKGDLMVEESTAQEIFTLNTANLTPGKRYFWFVKAKLADGTVIDSNIAKFLFVK